MTKELLHKRIRHLRAVLTDANRQIHAQDVLLDRSQRKDIPTGLQHRSETMHLHRGNLARIINLKVKHDTNIHSVRIHKG